METIIIALITAIIITAWYIVKKYEIKEKETWYRSLKRALKYEKEIKELNDIISEQKIEIMDCKEELARLLSKKQLRNNKGQFTKKR